MRFFLEDLGGILFFPCWEVFGVIGERVGGGGRFSCQF